MIYAIIETTNDVAIINRHTLEVVSQDLKTMQCIKQHYRAYLNNQLTMCFSEMNQTSIEILTAMLPKN
ncbi:MAG: hypothetical protein COA65_09675 [Rhodospirillaceae bacterium]|nr:MAG: hypothetical protein COA65_09675 [Rhodospirillaceae bacterium]